MTISRKNHLQNLSKRNCSFILFKTGAAISQLRVHLIAGLEKLIFVSWKMR